MVRITLFYEPGTSKHGLPYDPFKSCVVPRPIGWISSLDSEGVANLAPFSQFQNLTFDPPYVMFAANQNSTGRRKDTVRNVEATGEFVWNMATYALREAVNASAQEVPPHVDEFALAGLAREPATLVRPPRVAASPIHFECAYVQTIRLPGSGKMGTVDIVIGRVLGIHINDDVIDERGRVDIVKIRPIARLGYYDYTSVDSTFEMVVAGANEDLLAGLEGVPEHERV
jgi:flavin reductase (DIM6/NTAB) family NADH-FMN oxidoreductase RutF